MEHFIPTSHAGETCTNVRRFVEKNNSEIWKIFKPLIPYIVGLYFFDAVISALFFSAGDTGFFLGSTIASYFYICLLISWHRFVIKGPENYTPMNPLNPQNNEIGFIGVGLAIWLAIFLAMSATYSFVENMKIMDSFFLGLPLIVIVFVVSIYAAYRFWFYFPAKAVDDPVTLMEAFGKSRGCLWQLIYASFLASLKIIVFMLLYIVVFFVIGVAISFMTGIKLDGFIMNFLFDLPIHLYFQPVLVALGITAVSNYYLHVLQNLEESTGEAASEE